MSSKRHWDLAWAPDPYPNEARSSWLARTAHAHGLLVSELLELHACSLPQLDRGMAEAAWCDIVARTSIAPPLLDRVTFALNALGPNSGLRPPRWPIGDWWSFCPACVLEDLVEEGITYIRSAWVHPLSFACQLHEQALKPWPHGIELLLPDGSLLFDTVKLEASSQRTLPKAVLEAAAALENPAASNWPSAVAAIFTLAAVLNVKTGSAHFGVPAYALVTEQEQQSSIQGAHQFDLLLPLEADAHARLSLIEAAARIFAFDPSDVSQDVGPQLRASLKQVLRSARRSWPRRHALAATDPLFVVLANVNPRATEAMLQGFSAWPPEFKARVRAALFVSAMANLA